MKFFKNRREVSEGTGGRDSRLLINTYFSLHISKPESII
jgi:hypothetical protein